MKKIIVFILVMILLSACSGESKKIEVVETEVGVFFLNQNSGHIYRVDSSGLIELPVQRHLVREAENTQTAKRYVINQNIHQESFSLKGLSKADNDRLFYRFDLEAIKEEEALVNWLNDNQRSGFVTITLRDQDGFNIFESRIDLSKHSFRYVGDDSMVTGLLYEGDSYINSSRLTGRENIIISWNIRL